MERRHQKSKRCVYQWPPKKCFFRKSFHHLQRNWMNETIGRKLKSDILKSSVKEALEKNHLYKLTNRKLETGLVENVICIEISQSGNFCFLMKKIYTLYFTIRKKSTLTQYLKVSVMWTQGTIFCNCYIENIKWLFQQQQQQKNLNNYIT